MFEELLPLEYKVKSYLASFQKICYSSKKIVFINVRKEFVLPTVYEIGNGSVTPQPWLFKIVLHDRRKCKSDCRFVVGEIMLSGLPFIEEITQEKNLEIALRHADFLIVQPIQAFPFNELEKNIRNEFTFLKELSLAVKKCARETIQIIVISPYTGVFEYLIMKISDTPGEQISGLSRYSEARAVHYIAEKLRVKLGAINNIVLLGDNIIDCGSATVSRDLKPGREISIWEVMQLPKPLLGFIGYDELRECTSIVPAEATAKDRVFNAVQYSLETVIEDSKFMKYLTEPEQKALTKRILYREARRKKEEEMEKVEGEQEELYEEEYGDEYKEYFGDIGGKDAMYAMGLMEEGAFGKQIPETNYTTSEGTDQYITETEMKETTLEDIYQGEHDIDEYREGYFDYEGFDRAGDEYRLLFKHLVEEEEIAIRQAPPDTRPLISYSFEELLAKLQEKPLEEDLDSSKTHPGLKKAIMKDVEDDAWCKYSLLKLVENDGPPYGYALASSFLGHFKRIIQGSEKISSMTVMSDGSYQIPEGIFSAFPVKICVFSKKIEIVNDMNIFTVTMNRIKQFVHRQQRIYCFINDIIEEEGLPEVERLPDSSTDEDMADAEGEDMLLPNLLQKKKLEKIKGNKIDIL